MNDHRYTPIDDNVRWQRGGWWDRHIGHVLGTLAVATVVGVFAWGIWYDQQLIKAHMNTHEPDIYTTAGYTCWIVWDGRTVCRAPEGE